MVEDYEKEEQGNDNQLHEYDHALEIAHHTDTIIHEVTAIVWGANTLLLGFILEVPCESDNQKLVVLSAIVGMAMSVYVPWIYKLAKKGQRAAFQVCREIENDSSLNFKRKVHTKIGATYPKWHPGEVAMWCLTVLFFVGWIYVAGHARSCLLKHAMTYPETTSPRD